MKKQAAPELFAVELSEADLRCVVSAMRSSGFMTRELEQRFALAKAVFKARRDEEARQARIAARRERFTAFNAKGQAVRVSIPTGDDQ